MRIRTRMNHNQVLSLAKLRPYIYYAHDGEKVDELLLPHVDLHEQHVEQHLLSLLL